MTKKADVILVGGGSGGHLTPLVPIAQQLHKSSPCLRIAHIGQRGDPLNSITECADISQHYEVSAGKFRRYHTENLLRKMLNVKDNLLNARDAFRVVAGIYQSWILLGKLKPKVIMMKGGYVGVPVGIAARMRRIPYITHDSDAMISLANKIISKGATYHAVAQDPEIYTGYNRKKTIKVGVPISPLFQRVTPKMQKEAKIKLEYTTDDRVLLVVGGGLGARKINMAVAASAQSLLSDDERLRIIHITGKKLFQETKDKYADMLDPTLESRVKIEAFSAVLHELSAAANVIVTRAGATNMAEFSAQAKACIVVPNPLLTGGHQSKNASVFEQKGAAIILDETKLDEDFISTLSNLLDSKSKQKSLGSALHSLYVPDAAEKIAGLLIEVSGS